MLCGVLQGCVTLCDFLYGSALSRECCGVSNLVVFWIQRKTAFEYVESNTKKVFRGLLCISARNHIPELGPKNFEKKVGVQYITFTSALEIFI